MIGLERHEDLARLRKRVSIPEVFASGAWVAFPLGGSTSDLGPTTTQLLVWLPVADDADVDLDLDTALRGGQAAAWSDVIASLGEPGLPASRTIAASAATALLPPDVRAQLATDGAAAIVAGRTICAAPFENVFWKHGWAIGLPGGILVSLVSS